MMFGKLLKSGQPYNCYKLDRLNPRDVHGNVLALGDLVAHDGDCFYIVAMSRYDEVAINFPARLLGSGEKWVRGSEVEFMSRELVTVKPGSGSFCSTGCEWA